MVETHDENEQREYELAYVVETPEAEGALCAHLGEKGVAIAKRGECAPLKLAYPIKKKTSAFFGFYEITSSSPAIRALESSLEHFPGLVRHLLLRRLHPAVSHKGLRNGNRYEGANEPPRPAQEEKKIAIEAPALTNEALEEKLEEMLQ